MDDFVAHADEPKVFVRVIRLARETLVLLTAFLAISSMCPT